MEMCVSALKRRYDIGVIKITTQRDSHRRMQSAVLHTDARTHARTHTAHTVLHIYRFIDEGEAAWYRKFCSCQMVNIFTTINRPPANSSTHTQRDEPNWVLGMKMQSVLRLASFE